MDEHYFYKEYFRGKTNDQSPYYGKNKKDVDFELKYNEIIMFYMEVKCKPHDPGTILITIDNNEVYTVYEFCQEVDNDEYSLDYYGYDDLDYNRQILMQENKFDKINDINITMVNKDGIDYINWGRLYGGYLIYKEIMNQIWKTLKML